MDPVDEVESDGFGRPVWDGAASFTVFFFREQLESEVQSNNNGSQAAFIVVSLKIVIG